MRLLGRADASGWLIHAADQGRQADRRDRAAVLRRDGRASRRGRDGAGVLRHDRSACRLTRSARLEMLAGAPLLMRSCTPPLGRHFRRGAAPDKTSPGGSTTGARLTRRRSRGPGSRSGREAWSVFTRSGNKDTESRRKVPKLLKSTATESCGSDATCRAHATGRCRWSSPKDAGVRLDVGVEHTVEGITRTNSCSGSGPRCRSAHRLRAISRLPAVIVDAAPPRRRLPYSSSPSRRGHGYRRCRSPRGAARTVNTVESIVVPSSSRPPRSMFFARPPARRVAGSDDDLETGVVGSPSTIPVEVDIGLSDTSADVEAVVGSSRLRAIAASNNSAAARRPQRTSCSSNSLRVLGH